MGLIGLSPSNFFSPIDLVPGLGPLNRLRKAAKYLNKARKSKTAVSLLGKGRYYANAGMGLTHGTLGAGGLYYDYRATKYVLDTTMDLYDFVVEHEDHFQRVQDRRGKLMLH